MNLDKHTNVVFARYDHLRLTPIGLVERNGNAGKYPAHSMNGAAYLYLTNDGVALCASCATEEGGHLNPLDAVGQRYEMLSGDATVTCCDCGIEVKA